MDTIRVRVYSMEPTEKRQINIQFDLEDYTRLMTICEVRGRRSLAGMVRELVLEGMWEVIASDGFQAERATFLQKIVDDDAHIEELIATHRAMQTAAASSDLE